MIIVKSNKALAKLVAYYKQRELTVGFVPTMGALHDGHLALIKEARSCSDVVISSIFVNPTQFNNTKDLALYPRTPEKDIYILQKSDCHILYLPAADEIYPSDFVPPQYELGKLEEILEGEYRPGHYQGVCMVVERLLNIVRPDSIFLGKKDYQQCMVLSKIIADRNIPVQIHLLETVRMDTGLARSSRNERLSKEEKKNAANIYSTLTNLAAAIASAPLKESVEKDLALLQEKGFKVDYLTVADRKNLLPVKEYEQGEVVILIAAYLGEVRLIDNIEC